MKKTVGYQAVWGISMLLSAVLLPAAESAAPQKTAAPAAPAANTAPQKTAAPAAPAANTAPQKTAAPAVSDNSGNDAATFAGNVNPGERYLRLGMLAHENDDASSAINFLQTALKELKDPILRRQTVGLLHESLLDSERFGDADALLMQAEKSPDFVQQQKELQLMRGRRLFYSGGLQEAAAIFRELSVQLLPGDAVCMQALELLARTMIQTGDVVQAQKSYADLAAVAVGNDLWSFKAREGMIFAALAAENQTKVQEAWQQMQQLPNDIKQIFSDRMTKLSWLVECSSGKIDAVEKKIEAAAAKSSSPDPLLARAALAVAKHLDPVKNGTKTVKYAKMAYQFAEKSFRQFALGNVIDLEIKAGLWSDALASVESYLEIFPSALNRTELLFSAGSLNNKLNRHDAALEYFRQIYDDGNAAVSIRHRAALELAKLYQKSSRTGEAVSMLEFAIRSAENAEQKSHCQQQLGEYLYLLGRYADAVEYFEAAASADANLERATLFLAQSLYQLKSYSKAQAALEKIPMSENKDMQRQTAYLKALLAEHLRPADEAIKLLLDFVKQYAGSAEAPGALFQSGVLAAGSERYSDRDIFLKYAEDYPGEQAANALYKALTSTLAAGSEEAGREILNKLDKNYPESKYTTGGHFRMIAYQRQIKRYKEALASLDVLEKRNGGKNSELQSELLYDRALLLEDLQDHDAMLKVLETLIKQHSDKPVAPRAFFLYGDWLSRQGKFAEARAAFLQAQERSAGTFSYGCAGRAADAAYSLYAARRQEQYLRQAQDEYSNLLKVSSLPAELYFQTLYKLARCRKDAGDEGGALKLCREIIYQALLAGKESRYYPPHWCAQALDMALKMIVSEAKQISEADQLEILINEGRRLLKAAEQLDLPGENIAGQQTELDKIYPSKP